MKEYANNANKDILKMIIVNAFSATYSGAINAISLIIVLIVLDSLQVMELAVNLFSIKIKLQLIINQQKK